MTYIYYSMTDGVHELSIYGHADYDSEGRDIVCSAVSAIGYTLLGFLENEAHDISDYAEDSGKLCISAQSTDQVDTAFEMAIIGFMQIARQYPKYVSISDSPHHGRTLI